MQLLDFTSAWALLLLLFGMLAPDVALFWYLGNRNRRNCFYIYGALYMLSSTRVTFTVPAAPVPAAPVEVPVPHKDDPRTYPV